MKHNREYNGEDEEATWDNVSILKLNEPRELQILVLQEDVKKKKIHVPGKDLGFVCLFVLKEIFL